MKGHSRRMSRKGSAECADSRNATQKSLETQASSQAHSNRAPGPDRWLDDEMVTLRLRLSFLSSVTLRIYALTSRMRSNTCL